MELKDYDIEKQNTPSKKIGPRITYADAVDEEGPSLALDRSRYISFGRERRNSTASVLTARTGHSLELSRTISRRRSIDPETTLPIGFRTLSIHVENTKEKYPLPTGKEGKSSAHAVELTNLDWHKISADELVRRLLTSSTEGLSKVIARTTLARDGPNKLTPINNRWAQRIFWYIFVRPRKSRRALLTIDRAALALC